MDRRQGGVLTYARKETLWAAKPFKRSVKIQNPFGSPSSFQKQRRVYRRFFFDRRFLLGACVRADAATLFTFFDVRLLRSNLLASLATRLDVLSFLAMRTSRCFGLNPAATETDRRNRKDQFFKVPLSWCRPSFGNEIHDWPHFDSPMAKTPTVFALSGQGCFFRPLLEFLFYQLVLNHIRINFLLLVDLCRPLGRQNRYRPCEIECPEETESVTQPVNVLFGSNPVWGR
jgi:hypothetical protein